MRTQWRAQMHGMKARAANKRSSTKYTRTNIRRSTGTGFASDGNRSDSGSDSLEAATGSQGDVPDKQEMASQNDEEERAQQSKQQQHHETAYAQHDPSRCSSTDSHERIRRQLDGLKDRAAQKAEYEAQQTSERQDSGDPFDGYAHFIPPLAQYSFHSIQEEEERFLRLARLAKEWRRAQGVTDGVRGEQRIPTPRELLQTAVEAASLGAFN